MKSPYKLIIAAVLIAAALGSVTSAVAQAAKCEAKAGTKHYILCVNGEKVESTSKPEEISSQLRTGGKISLRLLNGAVEIICKNQTLGAEASQSTFEYFESVRFSSVMTLSACSVEGESRSRCSVPSTILWKTMHGDFGPTAEAVKFTPSAGTLFVEIPLLNNGAMTCPYKSWSPVRISGSFKCTLKQATTETALKELACKSTESELLEGAAKVPFAGLEDTVQLIEPHKTFSIIEA